jgi:hypothetical protein
VVVLPLRYATPAIGVPTTDVGPMIDAERSQRLRDKQRDERDERDGDVRALQVPDEGWHVARAKRDSRSCAKVMG